MLKIVEVAFRPVLNTTRPMGDRYFNVTDYTMDERFLTITTKGKGDDKGFTSIIGTVLIRLSRGSN